ncbi:Phosphoinositide phospholipase C 6 [Hibiscus syriacus]|uniref:Phosphoinositide phospholipase C n=1 Tax=Hibiscus syriacus TaxID=106335 RepID=A0A6A2ZCA8_HIBSY|nr:Phosphoinositide phospholipase C 6 [Hibiscus syriacus]
MESTSKCKEKIPKSSKSQRKKEKPRSGKGKEKINGGSSIGSYNYRLFSFFNRKFKINEVKPPPDVNKAFELFTDDSLHMSADQLRRFLAVHQNDVNTRVDDAQHIIEQVMSKRHPLTKVVRNTLSLDDFFYFMFSDDLNGPIRTQVHHDMTAPLSHYYIYTGHNSYLTGNQLSSDCSEVPIIKALQSGVRVIELDLWPSSSNTEIYVLHGRTLTSPVSLIQCLVSIREYAFVSSPYPVVITLEDHLTPELQAKAAEMINQTFESLLNYPDTDCLTEFPSPESLKYRIMISTKPPKEYLDSRSKDSDEENSPRETNDSEGVFPWDGNRHYEFGCFQISELLFGFRYYGFGYLQSESEEEDEDIKSVQAGVVKYKRLITISAGKPRGGLKEALKVDPDKVQRLSISEQQLEKAAGSLGLHVVYAEKYPANLSEGYSFYLVKLQTNHRMDAWSSMVAFNIQGYGKHLWVMHGMFRANGGCGYVMKPEYLTRSSDQLIDPKATFPVKKMLKIYIAGVPADEAKRKTKVIEDDWIPVWDEEFTFPLTVPELALLRIEVREYDLHEKDDFGGQTCLPIPELKTGIRSVPLHDRKGVKYENVRLLMFFEFEEIV